jgi:hypothetical protein
MKMLMFHVDHFWYIPDESKSAPSDREQFGESLLVWIQSEKHDENDRVGVLRKMVKNIRWLCGKANVNQVILHSFAHLSESKSDPAFADGLIEETYRRLIERDFEVHIVPFGKFNEFEMHVKGPSLAKVYKSF